MMQAAVYVRVSTTKDIQRDSPEHQLGICREKSMLLGFEQPDDLVYEDRDSGTSIIDRPAIRQLMEHAKQGAYQVVIFASLSRFSRDMMDSLLLKRTLVDSLHIRLISIDENFDSYIDNDEFKFQIFAAVNQKQSELISLSSRRGLRQSGLKGNFTGSIAPYGYRKVVEQGRKTLAPDRVTKMIVREIFDLYTEHQYGEKAIVKYLNEKGIPSPKLGLWGVTSVQRILQNAVYTGENIFSKYEIIKIHQLEDLHHRKKRLVQRDKQLWERSMIGLTHEPIIERKVFEKAQQIRLIKGGGKRGGVRHKTNVFAGYISCKHCGSALVSVRSSQQAGRAVYHYLVCSKRRRQGELGCSNGYRLPYESFYEAIRVNLASMMEQITTVEELMKQYQDNIKVSSHLNNRLDEEQALQLKINRYREALYLLRKSYVEGELEAKQYEYEKNKFEQELNRCENQWQQRVQELDEGALQDCLKQQVSQKLLAMLQFTTAGTEDLDEAQRFLRHWIAKIVVDHNGHIDVFTTYTPTCGFQNISRT